jgi:hypothetical protein
MAVAVGKPHDLSSSEGQYLGPTPVMSAVVERAHAMLRRTVSWTRWFVYSDQHLMRFLNCALVANENGTGRSSPLLVEHALLDAAIEVDAVRDGGAAECPSSSAPPSSRAF